MGKKSVATRGSSRQQRTLRHGVHIELMMECIEEGLSQSQLDAFKKAENEYKAAMAKIKDANRREKEGTAIVITQARHGMPLPPPQLSATVYPQPQQPATRLTNQFQAQKPPDKPPPRSDSPDLIIVGETPPPAKPTPVQKPTPPQARLQPITQTHVTRILTDQTATRKGDFPHVYQFVNLQGQPVSQGKHQTQIISVMKPVAPVVPQQQQTRPLVNMQYITTNTVSNNKTALKNNEVILGNHGLGIKRVSDEDTGPAKKKKKPIETDESGNWVPLDEYYYSKKEGDPTYTEEKGEYRFKCWYCSKMLYNNVKAMMHLQGHIDSGRQHNLDLTDLTQCKHCYKQFDTPFEMQTHVEKVHMSNTNVLMCRICERDLDSRQALTTHMRQNHNACEMPYLCQLCNFRSSMYSDVVDHFKKKHDSSQNILCLYCLRVFKVKFVSQGWGQTQTYYGHLLKHQSKTSAKKCNLCRLTFFNPVDVKAHKKKDHLPNHKGIQGTAIHTSPGQVMIKVPESGLHVKQQNLKSLNAPAVSKVLDFGGTKLPVLVNYLTCLECKTSMGTPDHFKKHIECSMCRFATSCSIAYANHMMGFHSGQMSSLNLNIPWERKMKCHLYCLCGFGSRYGNNIANHLVFCAKRTCYLQKPDVIPDDNISDEDVDPRHKPGASILDVLGLVKKRTVSTKETVDKDSVEMDKLNEIRRRTRENSPPPKSPPPSVRRKPRDITPPKSPVETKEENVPEELKGAQKWNTVKIKDTKQPSKASVFLGGVIDDVQESPGSTIPLEENEESQTKKLNESADGDQKDAEDCPMKVEHGDLTVKNTESTAENSKSIDGNNEPSGKDDESTSKDAESVGECSESNSESTKSTYLSAELTSKKVDNSDEHKIEDSLLNQTEDEPNDDSDSKLDDSVLEHQDSVTMVNDGLKEHSGNDSKMEASETNSEAGVTSELACTQSNVEQSELVSLENANKVDIKSSATDCDISVNNAGSIEGDKGVDNLKPSIEVTNSDEAESSSNDQSEHLKPSKDESKKNKENDNNQVTEDNNSVGNDGEQIQTEHKSQEVGNTTEQKSGEKDNKEPSHEESEEINTVTKETKHSEQPEENKTSEIESGENSKVNNKNKPEDNVKIDEEKDVKSTTTNTDHRKSGSVEDIKSTTTNTDHRKSGSVEDVKSTTTNTDHRKSGSVEDIKSTTTNTDHRKSGSVEKEYKSESKEHKYEERQENEEHSKHHGEGRSYESHRQDYHRSSEGHRHSDRSNDRDYYRDRDHHYRDREQYRDGDRYHDRNYHGHHNDRNFNRHGAGYYSNQSHGSGRWDDRQDDYRNRYRDYDRYQRGRRGGGYGHHSNYR